MKACAEACARDWRTKCLCALSKLPDKMEDEAMRIYWEMW
jgi:hypothetical protein